jgi:hypothetical protein
VGYDSNRIKYTDIYNEYNTEKNIHENHMSNNNSDNNIDPDPSPNHIKNNDNHLHMNQYQWPTTPEEYAVFALRLNRDKDLRNIFQKKNHNVKIYDTSHGDQFIDFSLKLLR